MCVPSWRDGEKSALEFLAIWDESKGQWALPGVSPGGVLDDFNLFFSFYVWTFFYKILQLKSHILSNYFNTALQPPTCIVPHPPSFCVLLWKFLHGCQKTQDCTSLQVTRYLCDITFNAYLQGPVQSDEPLPERLESIVGKKLYEKIKVKVVEGTKVIVFNTDITRWLPIFSSAKCSFSRQSTCRTVAANDNTLRETGVLLKMPQVWAVLQ